MDLRPTVEMTDVAESFGRLLANESTTAVVRAAEPLGFDADLWKLLVGAGVTTMGIPGELGGEGADLRTLAVLARLAGRHLTPVPLVESIVAGRLLARHGVAVDDISDSIATVALCAPIGAVARLVPAGAVADRLVALDGDELVVVEEPGVAHPAPPNLGSLPVADRTVRGPTVSRCILATGDAASRAFAGALAEWRLLTAALLVGSAAEALRLGVEYVKERHQFGVPIGSFQSVAHRLADVATAVDGADLLVHEAAWAADMGSARAPELAAMAFLFAATTASHAALDVLHVHGGYGFMAEYDIQLHVRRTKAWALLAGTTHDGYAQLATLLYGPAEVA